MNYLKMVLEMLAGVCGVLSDYYRILGIREGREGL